MAAIASFSASLIGLKLVTAEELESIASAALLLLGSRKVAGGRDRRTKCLVSDGVQEMASRNFRVDGWVEEEEEEVRRRLGMGALHAPMFVFGAKIWNSLLYMYLSLLTKIIRFNPNLSLFNKNHRKNEHLVLI